MVEVNDDILWLTVPEAQAYLKVSKPTIYQMMRDGRLPFYYIKGTNQRRVKKSDVDSLLILGTPGDLPPDAGEE
jgi:excisionase family DNA binding protein